MRQSRRSPAVPLILGALAVVLGLLAAGGYLRRTGGDSPGVAASREPTSASPSSGPVSPPPAPASPTAAPSPTDTRPVAAGGGTPDCNGPCKVEHRLTRSFLPRYSGQQTLLLASSTEADAAGNFLHAFLVDAAGRVLWQEHGFGWSFQRVDGTFAVRFDDAGHVFWRAYVADATYLYVLHTTGPRPRLVGAPGREGTDGFANAEVVERAGEAAFRIRELVPDCPEGYEDPEETCPTVKREFRWNGTAYVAA